MDTAKIIKINAMSAILAQDTNMTTIPVNAIAQPADKLHKIQLQALVKMVKAVLMAMVAERDSLRLRSPYRFAKMAFAKPHLAIYQLISLAF